MNPTFQAFRLRLAGLGVAISIWLALMVLSFVRILGDTNSMEFQNVVHDSLFVTSIWGTALARNLAVFFLALILLYVAFATLCWLLALLSHYAFPNVKASRVHWVFLWCCLAFAWVFIANAALFPNTSFGDPYRHTVQREVLGLSVLALATCIAAAAVVALLLASAIRWVGVNGLRSTRSSVAGIAVVAAGVALAIPLSHGVAAPSRKPHVIIIGIDSLRYDATTDADAPAHAPGVKRFLTQAVSFSDATTPLARTFPSWVSVLTGRHPHTTGAVINLLPRDLINTGSTVGDLFRKAGYQTVYGIDETRFSNIDASYGFDETVTPRIGASDFLIGWFGDTPLSNLVVNTRLGAVLFPYLHANRGAATVYDPDMFVARLERRLDFDQPTLLAVHLTLPHWPFTWADSPEKGTVVEAYGKTVTRVDQQFETLMAMLERRGALANALVVVLSDHGEAFSARNESLVHESSLGALYDAHKAPAGHGTDVLSPQQYHVVLAMRPYGACPIQVPAGKLIDVPVSLEDVAPTLADLFALDSREAFDGRSLRPLWQGTPDAAQAFRARVRFTESEFNPTGLMSKDGKVSASAAAAALIFYRFDPVTDRIEVRREKVAQVLEQRQYAAFQGNQFLAALPRSTGGGYELVTATRDGTNARVLTETPQPDTEPQLSMLLSALINRFGLAERTSPNSIAN